MERKKQEKPTLVAQGENTQNITMKKATATNNRINILPIYQTCMDHEQSIRISYQSLLTTLEVALFALLITLYQLELRDFFWLLAIAGIFLCFSFGTACEFRARNVDIWRIRIVKLVRGTQVEDAFKEGKYGWIPLGKAGFKAESLIGHWFERVLIPIMLLMWLLIIWYFPIELSFSISLLIRLFLTFIACSWILYAFGFTDRLIERTAFSDKKEENNR